MKEEIINHFTISYHRFQSQEKKTTVDLNYQ